MKLTKEKKQAVWNYYKTIPARQGKRTVADQILSAIGTSIYHITSTIEKDDE